MDAAFFERLLYEEENPTLDFKKEQYRFAKASEDEKSELLKDILGFVNSWRRSEAFILVGVEEVRGGRSKVVGITNHLDDHSLQQFVNSLTSRPVIFRYEAFGVEGKQVGIIRIDEQPRPIYLNRNYGKLQKDLVYVRRGSSTDPTKPATPDEISRMGSSSVPDQAELAIEFAGADRDMLMGLSASIDSEFCNMPSMDQIPTYGYSRSSMFERSLAFGLNENYWRELVRYEFLRRLFHPLRVVIANMGRVAARSVRVELRVDVEKGFNICYPSFLPRVPKKTGDLPSRNQVPEVRSSVPYPGALTIEKDQERFLIEIDCGDLQPGRKVWSDPLMVGSRESRSIAFNGHIFAENLAQPKEVSLSVTLAVSQRDMSFEDVKSLPIAQKSDDE